MAWGADVFYRSLKGVRTAFVIAGFTSLITIPLGLFFGLLAGYKCKWIDDVITYVYTVSLLYSKHFTSNRYCHYAR